MLEIPMGIFYWKWTRTRSKKIKLLSVSKLSHIDFYPSYTSVLTRSINKIVYIDTMDVFMSVFALHKRKYRCLLIVDNLLADGNWLVAECFWNDWKKCVNLVLKYVLIWNNNESFSSYLIYEGWSKNLSKKRQTVIFSSKYFE